jgi:hypothetical protein
VKSENGDLLADSHTILNLQKNHFSLLLNVHNVSDISQIELHTAEPLKPEVFCDLNFYCNVEKI